jgi:hypothetical protein
MALVVRPHRAHHRDMSHGLVNPLAAPPLKRVAA